MKCYYLWVFKISLNIHELLFIYIQKIYYVSCTCITYINFAIQSQIMTPTQLLIIIFYYNKL